VSGAAERAVWALGGDVLSEYAVGQRWFGSKARSRLGAHVVDTAVLREREPSLVLALLAVRFRPGTHELYQLPLGLRRRADGWRDVSIGDAAGFTVYDALADPALARELVHRIRAGGSVAAGEGVVAFHRCERLSSRGAEIGAARPVGGEQSNSSIVFDDELVLKVYRRVEPGVNPELEVLRFLTQRGFPNVAPLGGWYAYVGRPLEATLGIVQRFVPGGLDGWELALDELVSAPDRLLERLRRLGGVTARMHNVLASDSSDPAFRPEDPGPEMLGRLTATIDEEIERAFLELPEDVEAVAPIVGRGEELRERLRRRTRSGETGRAIRHHGDYHLGQTLWTAALDRPVPRESPGSGGGARSSGQGASGAGPAAGESPDPRERRDSGESAGSGRGPRSGDGAGPRPVGDWVILDFEGEPARPLAERRQKRSPLRDVAGMLRSFAYAASAVEILRGAAPPPGWEERARTAFVEGYRESVDPSIVPTGREAFDRLLSVFELEKAVYELRYELNARPDWVSVPVAGILRLLAQPVET
jgi:predicted trehalose synthase